MAWIKSASTLNHDLHTNRPDRSSSIGRTEKEPFRSAPS